MSDLDRNTSKKEVSSGCPNCKEGDDVYSTDSRSVYAVRERENSKM